MIDKMEKMENRSEEGFYPEESYQLFIVGDEQSQEPEPPLILRCPECAKVVDEVYSGAYHCEKCDTYHDFDSLLKFEE